MQNVGLIYVSLVKPNDIGMFNTLNTINSKQMELLSVETSLDIDETSIQIYGKGKDDNSDGDFIGGSFLSLITVDSTSIHAGEIGDIFNSIMAQDKGIEITRPSTEQVLITVRPGSVISSRDREFISKTIKETSLSYDIQEFIDQLLCSIEVSGDIPSTSSAIQLNLDEPKQEKIAPSTTPESIGVDMDQLALKVFGLLKDDLLKEGSELNSLVNEIRGNKDTLERNIVDSVMLKVSQKIEALPTITQPPVAETNTGIESVESIMKGICADNIEHKEVSETTIYDTQIQLKDLMEGCESDAMLFDRVMQNKDKLSLDDLNNVVRFNMFEYFGNNDNVRLTNREQLMRKIKLGLN